MQSAWATGPVRPSPAARGEETPSAPLDVLPGRSNTVYMGPRDSDARSAGHALAGRSRTNRALTASAGRLAESLERRSGLSEATKDRLDEIAVHLKEDELPDVIAAAQREEALLAARTGTILTVNGLAAVAVGLGLPGYASFVVSLLTVGINLLWTWRGFDSHQVIRGSQRVLSEYCQKKCEPEGMKFPRVLKGREIRLAVQGERQSPRPTMSLVFGVIVPGVLVAGWVLGLLVGSVG